MIERAIEAGVSRFFVPSIDSSYTEKMYVLEAQFPSNIFLMMGLHPCYVKPETYQQELVHVEKALAAKKFYAVGEIGIDLFWDKTTLQIQQEAFKLNSSILSKPTQLLEAPVSKIKFPVTPFILALINKCCVLETLKLSFLYFSFLKTSYRLFINLK